MNLVVRRQKFPPPTAITDQKFTIDQLMPATWSRLSRRSKPFAKGSRLPRNRIHTEVSTRSITRPSASPAFCHAVEAHLVRSALIPAEPVAARKPHASPAPPTLIGQCPCPLSRRSPF